MILSKHRIQNNNERKAKWRDENLVLYAHIVKSDKYPTLRLQAMKLEELGIRTIKGYTRWDTRNVFRLTKDLIQHGYISKE